MNDARRQRALEWAALALAGAWCGYFLFTGMPQLSFEVFPRTVVLHAMVGGLAIVYAVSLAIRRRLPGGTPIDYAVLAFIVAYALATIVSISWRVSLEPALQIGGAIIVFYALCDLPLLSALSLKRALMLTAFALAIYALWVVGDDYADYVRFVRRVEGLDASNVFPPTVPRVHDVSDHPNVLAMLLTLFLPFFALAAYRACALWERALGVAGLLAGGMALFLTLSRSGWIGAGAGIVFTLVAAWLTVRAWDREQQGFAPSWENLVPRDISLTALATIAGALALAFAGTIAFISSAQTRPGWLFRSSLSPREDAWDAGLEMFGDHLLAGSGPHTFGLLYPQYSGRFLVHTQHAHNGFLQVANDAGIIGLLALGALALALVYMLLRTWRAGSIDQRLLAVACGGALVGFALHNQLDAGNIWKAPGIALALVGAIIVRNYRESTRAAATDGEDDHAVGRHDSRLSSLQRREPQLHLAVRALLLVLIAVPLAGYWWVDRAHNDYWRGVDDANQGRFASALDHLEDAVEADSSNAAYRLQLGQAQATVFMHTNDGQRQLIERAVVNIEQAARIEKRSDIIRANLARAYQLAGRDDDAAREANITRLAVHHVPPVLAVAEVYEDLGREDEAIETYGQVLSMDAGLAASSFWETSDWRREHFDEILAASSLGINPCTFGSYIVDARRLGVPAPDERLAQATEGCKLLLLGNSKDLVYRTALGKILLAQGNAVEAFEHLDYAVDTQPDFGPARTELGRWYDDRGDIEEARHQWVVGGQLDEAESLLLLGRTYSPAQVPDDVRERLRDLLRTTGTSIQNDTISVLYYRLRWGRLSPVYAIIPDQWQTAVPRVYEEMQRALAEWDRAAGQ